VLQESVVEILTTQVGISSSGLDSEDTTADVQERNIESPSSKIEDENVLLGLGLTIETVCNGGSSGFVDDTENIQTSDGTSIFGGETLRVVEVGRDATSRLEAVANGVKGNTHVTTAFLTVLPSLASEISFILDRTMEEISWGLKVLSSPRYWTLMRGDPSLSMTENGQCCMSY